MMVVGEGCAEDGREDGRDGTRLRGEGVLCAVPDWVKCGST